MADDIDDSESDDEDLVQVSHMVPRHHRDKATDNTEWGGISEAVREVYRLLANGANIDTVRIKLKLDLARKRRRNIKEQIADLRQELSILEDREEELEARLSERQTGHGKFDELYGELETDLSNGYSVFPEHGKVKRAADVSDYTPSEIVDMLREDNPELPDHQFEEQSESGGVSNRTFRATDDDE